MLFRSQTGAPGFTLMLSSATGVAFTNSLASSRSLTNQALMNGSAVAAGDVDGDGLCDLFLGSLDSPSRLFKNLGDWKFKDATSEAGLDGIRSDVTSAALVDFDGDGDLDLVVNTFGKNTSCFLNDGHGKFSPAPSNLGLASDKNRTSMAWGDLNGDGFLDVYIKIGRAHV